MCSSLIENYSYATDEAARWSAALCCVHVCICTYYCSCAACVRARACVCVPAAQASAAAAKAAAAREAEAAEAEAAEAEAAAAEAVEAAAAEAAAAEAAEEAAAAAEAAEEEAAPAEAATAAAAEAAAAEAAAAEALEVSPDLVQPLPPPSSTRRLYAHAPPVESQLLPEKRSPFYAGSNLAVSPSNPFIVRQPRTSSPPPSDRVAGSYRNPRSPNYLSPPPSFRELEERRQAQSLQAHKDMAELVAAASIAEEEAREGARSAVKAARETFENASRRASVTPLKLPAEESRATRTARRRQLSQRWREKRRSEVTPRRGDTPS